MRMSGVHAASDGARRPYPSEGCDKISLTSLSKFATIISCQHQQTRSGNEVNDERRVGFPSLTDSLERLNSSEGCIRYKTDSIGLMSAFVCRK
jgi:hypothetical protein